MKFSVKESALKKAKHGLKVSKSINRYQAIINLIDQADIALPDELKKYVNDPIDYKTDDRFSKVEEYLPQLIDYYQKEAIAKDKIRLMKHLKIDANHSLMDKLGKGIEALYEGYANKEDYQQKINNLKKTIVKERLNHYLSSGKTKEYNDIVEQAFNEDYNPKELIHKLQSKQIPVLTDRLKKICTSFESLASVSSPEKMQDKMIGNVLDVINEDFKREIIILNDLKESRLTGNEILFRGLNVEPEKFIEQFINNPHRMLDLENNNDLFLYDIDRNWNKKTIELSNQSWEASGVYFSFNPYLAFGFVRNNGVLLEVQPHINKDVICGSNKNEWELITSKVDPEEIKAIYSVKDGKIVKVHKNPNFEYLSNSRPLSFEVGDDAEGSLPNSGPKGTEKKILHDGIKEYEETKFNRLKNYYQDYEDFIKKYKKEDVEKARNIQFERIGFKSYQQRWNACNNEPLNCKTIQELYKALKTAVSNDEKEEVKHLITTTKILSAHDEDGNSLLMQSIKDNSQTMFEFALANGANINAQNLRGETALHLASATGNLRILETLFNRDDINFQIKDVADRTAIYDVPNKQILQLFFDKNYKVDEEYNLLNYLMLVKGETEELALAVYRKLNKDNDQIEFSANYLLSESLQNNKLNIAKEILDLTNLKHINNAVSTYFLQSVREDKKEIFDLLLPYIKNYPQHMASAFLTSIKENREYMFKEILPYITQDNEIITLRIRSSEKYQTEQAKSNSLRNKIHLKVENIASELEKIPRLPEEPCIESQLLTPILAPEALEAKLALPVTQEQTQPIQYDYPGFNQPNMMDKFQGVVNSYQMFTTLARMAENASHGLTDYWSERNSKTLAPEVAKEKLKLLKDDIKQYDEQIEKLDQKIKIEKSKIIKNQELLLKKTNAKFYKFTKDQLNIDAEGHLTKEQETRIKESKAGKEIYKQYDQENAKLEQKLEQAKAQGRAIVDLWADLHKASKQTEQFGVTNSEFSLSQVSKTLGQVKADKNYLQDVVKKNAPLGKLKQQAGNIMSSVAQSNLLQINAKVNYALPNNNKNEIGR